MARDLVELLARRAPCSPSAEQTTAEPERTAVPVASWPEIERYSVRWYPSFTLPKYFEKKASFSERFPSRVSSKRPAFR